MRETEIEIKNRRNETLRGTLTFAPSSSPSKEEHSSVSSLAILCHGFYAERDHFLLTRISKTLLQDDAVCDATFRFDFSGSGESDGPWNGYGGYEEELADVEDVVTFFRSFELNRTRVFRVTCLLGHSKGAAAPMHYAAKHDDVPVIIGLASRFYMKSKVTSEEKKTLFEKGRISVKDEVAGNITITLTLAQYRSFAELDNTVVNAQNIKRAHTVLWIHGDRDTVTNMSNARAYLANFYSVDASNETDEDGAADESRNAERGKSTVDARVVIVKGANHMFTAPHTIEAAKIVRDALKAASQTEHLVTTTAAKP